MMVLTYFVFFCFFVTPAFSKSTQNDTEKSTDERIVKLENVVKSLTTTIQRLNTSSYKGKHVYAFLKCLLFPLADDYFKNKIIDIFPDNFISTKHNISSDFSNVHV